MSAATATRARLARLLVEARVELDAMTRSASALAEAREALAAEEPGRAVRSMVGVDLHQYYTALEAFFERVARSIDGEVPQGPGSHQQLLDQMAADLPPLRPALVDDAARTWLHDLRRFRHFFRHAYGVDLDVAHLRRHQAALLASDAGLRRTITAFLEHLRRTIEALAEAGP